MLIAPTLTANIAAKVAHGVADCLASNLFSEFIMNNRLVVASNTAICPDGAAKQAWFPNMPPAYADLLRGNLAVLASFGVRLTESRFLYRTALAAWERRDAERRRPLVAALGASAAGVAAEFAAHGAVLAPDAAVRVPVTTDTVACPASLISQQVVQQLPAGVELQIGAKAIVTAAARDAASARSIRISRRA